ARGGREMMRVVALVALGFVVFLATMLLRTPLDRLQPWFPAALQSGQQYSGSLVRGGVQNVNAANAVIDAQWALRPASVFLGQLGADVEFILNRSIRGESTVAVGLGRVVSINDLLVAFEAAQLDHFVLPGILRFSGNMRLDIREATVGQNRYGPAVGEITWQRAAVTGQIPVSLGDVKLQLSEVDGETRVDVSSSGGDVSLDGTVSLSPAGLYQTDVLVIPSPSASRNIVFTLESIAQPESGNRFRIRQSGDLAELL
ncbi:MAG: type II secretion system protein N, partial [Pseudomonadota bacterium]